MAEYVSSIFYDLYFTGPSDDPESFFIWVGIPIDGTSTGGDENTFSVGDDISFVIDDCGCDPPEPLVMEYFGFFEGGWVGRISCGCDPDNPEYEYALITTDQWLEEDQEIPVNQADFTVCFLAGTAIACPGGERPIEDLAVGDLVMTADGGVRPVRFVGRQTFATLFADPRRTRPVRIAAGALGEGLPVRDLCVSPDHALLVDGVLVQAGALVNGTTIAPMSDLPERFTYFHIEVDDHALILAEGVPAETFVDNVTRRRFDNWAEYEALYGEHAPSIAEMALPRVKSARQVRQATRDLLRRNEAHANRRWPEVA